ncbi:pimeloyl-ACP methyl ester carboxylesterase [Kribbella voronezhensis]|uniref:Pimeloyl-ACP methyl ester carboxylesterase n=1 Tax=Kribbella voronezhensis TaxID=2512212 RepID=A0A4R7T4Y2_9ACTN|nr:alpha/beta hydrolase [Kribbella voronezhensis]TDU86882.1 pimeloyl-ACP methyl ester carboxylesterase [Kribbella voronezhensis]
MKFRTLAAGLGISALSATALLVVPGSSATASQQQAAAVQTGPNRIAQRYLDQKPAWRMCGDPELKTSCAKIVVPRDWSDQARHVDIQLAISKAGGPAKGRAGRVVFGNPGGPGGAGLGMAPYLASQKALTKDHLAIGFDPRGTGDSANVTCQGAPGFTMDARDRDPWNLDLIAEASQLTLPYCEGQSRGLLPFVNTVQTVQDMDLIRQLLGYDKIDYVGYSAGTWLGAYYQTYYPTHVGRFVLDSNTDFTGPWLNTFIAQPQAFERRFREDFAPWAAKYDAQLKLGDSPRLVIRTYERLRAALKKEPAVEEFMDGSVKISYDQNTLDNIVTGDLYTKVDFHSLAIDLAFLRGLSEAQSKSGARAAQRKVDELPLARQQELVQRATRRTVGITPFGRPFADDAENATFTAVTCNDTEWPQGREYGEVLSARLGPRYPLLGWSMSENPCAFWDRPNLDLRIPTGKGLPTTLMVQSVHDPATNFSLAAAAHSRYAGSRLVTITGEGDHGIYGGVNKCADKIVNTFLATGKAPARDTTCAGEGIPAPSSGGTDPNDDDAVNARAPLTRIAGFTKAVSGYLR